PSLLWTCHNNRRSQHRSIRSCLTSRTRKAPTEAAPWTRAMPPRAGRVMGNALESEQSKYKVRNRADAVRSSIPQRAGFDCNSPRQGRLGRAAVERRNGERDFHDERRSAASAESCEAAQM